MSLDKARALLHQAEEDLRIACYDKCVSSSYFSCRMMAELYLLGRGLRDLPRRDDKLANLLRSQGLREEAELLLFLYGMRKKADYGGSLISREEAESSLAAARTLLKSLFERMGFSFSR